MHPDCTQNIFTLVVSWHPIHILRQIKILSCRVTLKFTHSSYSIIISDKEGICVRQFYQAFIDFILASESLGFVHWIWMTKQHFLSEAWADEQSNLEFTKKEGHPQCGGDSSSSYNECFDADTWPPSWIFIMRFVIAKCVIAPWKSMRRVNRRNVVHRRTAFFTIKSCFKPSLFLNVKE